MTRLTATAIALLGFSVLTARGGEFNPILSIGDSAPHWMALQGVDGKLHSLADLKSKDVVVVAFTCISCPYATDYEDRMIAFGKRHAGPDGKVALVAINVNKIEEDSLPKMTERAKQKNYTYSYLFDETQKIAQDFGATFTPEFFVLNKERKIVYMGAMDDSTDPAKIKANYLDDAVQAALAGQTPKVKETVARGCLVRYERRRAKR